MERPEAMDSGNIIMTGLDSNKILQSIKIAVESKQNLLKPSIPYEYTIENTSERVIKLIIGTSNLAHLWDGIVKNDLT